MIHTHAQYNGIKISTIHGSMEPSPYTLALLKNLSPDLFLTSPLTMDIGCGCGILGIYAAKCDAEVIFVDVDDASVKDTALNLLENDITSNPVAGETTTSPTLILKSNVFDQVSDDFKGKIDIILCNPASLPGPETKRSHYYSAGTDGRSMIEKLLIQSKEFLRVGGRVIMTHTSLANVGKTVELLQKLGYSFRILDKVELQFRSFYDTEHMTMLFTTAIVNSAASEYPLYRVCEQEGLYFETVFVLELTYNAVYHGARNIL